MIIKIPDNYAEDFMQLLINQLHKARSEALKAEVYAWEGEKKLKELEEIHKENEERSKNNAAKLKELEKTLKKELAKKC